jgi:catechol 2,3-dioxygenase-like lactoylglutathione lyase family enzyme
MAVQARYAHTNLIARDWRRLARFYEQVFGCSPVPPQRSLSGRWLEEATGLPGAEIQGIHLRLPGHGDRGPTLEIFQYSPALDRLPMRINRPGYGHIAFVVEDVQAARRAVLAAGGGEAGALTTVPIPGAGDITFVYLTDPEGNILELQRWG